MKTRRKKQTKRVLAGTLLALVQHLQFQFQFQFVHAEESQGQK